MVLVALQLLTKIWRNIALLEERIKGDHRGDTPATSVSTRVEAIGEAIRLLGSAI
jgi:hypothetical protein